MGKNVIFWISVRSIDPLLRKKHGNFNYLDISKRTWEYWCKKNDVIFYEYTTPTHDNTGENKVTWQRWFDVFKQLDASGIDYNKVALVDGSSMIRWNTPNFFDLVKDKPVAFRSLENVKWIYEGVQGYKSLFDGFDFDLTKYNSCGFQIFDKSHRPFLDILETFYYSNYHKILELQGSVKRGTDQPVYNYLSQIHNIEFDEISPAFMLTHLNRFDWFSHNWQLKTDMTPFFIKYGYIWFFSGFDRTQRQPLMEQTWNMIKHEYNYG